MPTTTSKETQLEIIALCEKVVYDRKGEEIKRLDMTGADGAIADYYMICTGLSEPHLGAIADHIRKEVRDKYGILPVTVDGTPQSRWVIVDYGFLMIHIMTQETRELYKLENLWGDVPSEDVVARLDEEHRRRVAENSDARG